MDKPQLSHLHSLRFPHGIAQLQDEGKSIPSHIAGNRCDSGYHGLEQRSAVKIDETEAENGIEQDLTWIVG
jgi:hypothetical protein